MDIPESLKKLLTEDEINQVKAEFDKQVGIRVESALHLYDEQASAQVLDLEKRINESHARKLQQVRDKYNNLIESINKRHENEITAEAERFKVRLAENVEKLINKKVNDAVDIEVIKEAARNNTALMLLKSLRYQLGIDVALMQESIRKPIADVKQKMQNALSYIKKLKAENETLTESLANSKADLLIESKVSTLNESQADHMRRMLKGKSVKFINEQFDYILDLYNENKQSQRETLRAEALNKRSKSKRNITEARRTRDLIPESARNIDDDAKLINEIAASMEQQF